MLWASTKLPQVMDDHTRQATIAEILGKQQPDGGWTLASLGPWNEHPAASTSLDLARSDSYATAFTTFVLKVAGGKSARKPAERALEWLKKHQDRETGAWPAVSMNRSPRVDGETSSGRRHGVRRPRAYFVNGLLPFLE
jgi:squalene-hopene/tetraprenyl-beta-curcumene cyclase